MTTMLRPQEDVDPEYHIDRTWFDTDRPDGISVMIRTRNEGHLIGEAMDSLSDLRIPYEINVVMNLCTDDTEKRSRIRRDSGRPINLFEYPFQSAKPGLENYCTPVDSIHSSIWYYNWSLSKSKYRYTMKWDSDLVASYEFLRELESKYDKARTTNFSTLFFDTKIRNHESWLNLNTEGFQYFKWKCYECPRHWEDDQQDLTATVLHVQSNTADKEWRRTAPWWVDDSNSPAADSTRIAFEKWLDKFPDSAEALRASHPESHAIMARLPLLEEYIEPIASQSMCRDPFACPADRILQPTTA
ncbi:hypothetical protein OHB12_23035 [Nocardia sp. NBC_01730]|uniref:hypothetical protein n=1 Tax=Nocardia sp. NBC_01730 TaxID=2975998 RepID=UPI002E144478|nr:hypothetical protein OHB12_23035 [Nocardia sp. NBC_01730]